MRLVIDLKEILASKIKKLEMQISDVKYERDHSATPMESASDKSRQLAEQLMDALSDEKSKLVILSRRPNISKPVIIYTLDTPLGERDFAIVPDGLGGSSSAGTSLLSEKAPLAQQLKDKKIGDTFIFNSQSITINKIYS